MAEEKPWPEWPERKINTPLRRDVDSRGPHAVASELAEIIREIKRYNPSKVEGLTVEVRSAG